MTKVAPGTQWCYIGKENEVYVMNYHGMDTYTFDKISKKGKINLSSLDQYGKELILQMLN